MTVAASSLRPVHRAIAAAASLTAARWWRADVLRRWDAPRVRAAGLALQAGGVALVALADRLDRLADGESLTPSNDALTDTDAGVTSAAGGSPRCPGGWLGLEDRRPSLALLGRRRG